MSISFFFFVAQYSEFWSFLITKFENTFPFKIFTVLEKSLCLIITILNGYQNEISKQMGINENEWCLEGKILWRQSQGIVEATAECLLFRCAGLWRFVIAT